MLAKTLPPRHPSTLHLSPWMFFHPLAVPTRLSFVINHKSRNTETRVRSPMADRMNAFLSLSLDLGERFYSACLPYKLNRPFSNYPTLPLSRSPARSLSSVISKVSMPAGAHRIILQPVATQPPGWCSRQGCNIRCNRGWLPWENVCLLRVYTYLGSARLFI